MTSVISPILNFHISRLNGSMGSGTDLGSTTISAASGFAAAKRLVETNGTV